MWQQHVIVVRPPSVIRCSKVFVKIMVKHRKTSIDIVSKSRVHPRDLFTRQTERKTPSREPCNTSKEFRREVCESECHTFSRKKKGRKRRKRRKRE